MDGDEPPKLNTAPREVCRESLLSILGLGSICRQCPWQVPLCPVGQVLHPFDPLPQGGLLCGFCLIWVFQVMSHALPNFPEPTWTKAKGDFSESYPFHVLGLSLRSRPLFHREIGRSLIMNENRSGWLTTPVLNYLIILSWQAFLIWKRRGGEKTSLQKTRKKKKLVLLITSLKYTCCWMAGLSGLRIWLCGCPSFKLDNLWTRNY